MNIEDIRKKRQVPTKYKPNSYRIFCEDIGNSSIPDDNKYSSFAPPIYTQPMIVPAQAIEDRNRPHAGRLAGFLRENAHTLNEPVNRVGSRNVANEEEKRWWEWKVDLQQDADWKNKRRSASNNGPRVTNSAGNDAYKTTYQHELGYVNKVNGNSVDALPNRHSYNPNTVNSVGIVPINDLNTFTNANEQQRVFLDKMSFEHQYDSRSDSNYQNRGKRQGAFVIEQIEPRPNFGTKIRPDSNKGTSVWDAMHPAEPVVGSLPPRPSAMYQKQPSNSEILRNQRRDPIGYFEDTKFGGSYGQSMPVINPGPNFNQNILANTQESNYKPSWPPTTRQGPPTPQLNGHPNGHASNQNDHYQSANDLLENAMNYQRPVPVSNGYHDHN